jgi:hypothetical protein
MQRARRASSSRARRATSRACRAPAGPGFDHAECFLLEVNWFNIEGFSTDDLDFLTEFVRSNAPFIFELAERQKAGPAVSALAP